MDPASQYNLMISKAILLSNKKPEKSIDLFFKTEEAFPKSVETLIYRGAVLLKMGKIRSDPDLVEKAEFLLNEAI